MLCQLLQVIVVTTLVAGAPQECATQPAQDIRASEPGKTPGKYPFSASDEKLLDEIQYGCFQYFWKEVGQPAQLAKDRLLAPVSSIAAVGFQLAALPIGVERGWITRVEGEQRAATVLRALVERADNKRHGMYLHFPDHNTGGMQHVGWDNEASTVDTALLIAGAMPAATYFGGDVKALADRLISDANWRRYATSPDGFISMAWKPRQKQGDLLGEGEFIKWYWKNSSDEERLVYFLAVAAPKPEFAVEPALYYKLERIIKRWGDGPPFVVSWPGNMFTYFFAHCFVDYRNLGPDNPATFGVDAPRVDWFENSRRATLTHRQRCIELAPKFRSFAPDRWGLAPCVGKEGYIVPETQPRIGPGEHLFDGTISPYAAGTAIMFAPAECVAALRAFRELKDESGNSMLWRDPKAGGYGLVDSFNLDQKFVCGDLVGIDEGPLLIGIENARTGLIWRLFMEHENAKRAVERLKLRN